MPLRGCCNRPCGKRALMRRPVNPARQTRDDNLPGGPQFGGDILRETLGVGRRVPRGHNGNHRPLQSIGVSLDEQVRRRIGDGRQRVRIFGVAHRDYALARVGEPVEVSKEGFGGMVGGLARTATAANKAQNARCYPVRVDPESGGVLIALAGAEAPTSRARRRCS